MNQTTVIGIAVGVSLGLLILFGLLFCCCWKAPKKDVKVGYMSVPGKGDAKGDISCLPGVYGRLKLILLTQDLHRL
jgi:hypothetical protein